MPALNEEQIIALLHLDGVGPRTASAVAEFAERTECMGNDLISIVRKAKAEGVKMPEVESREIDLALEKARIAMDKVSDAGGTILSRFGQNYPEQLKHIPQSPLLLYVLGNFRVLVDRPTVAIIGTREPTAYGLKWGRRIAQVLGEKGFTIVSGLAEGIDTAAHLGALDVNAPTVAFLAHGFGQIYPKSNKALAEKIIAQGGCLVTEYLPGEPPRRSSFVERDRLQSGSSRGIVVVETDVEGGTMHTVGFAKLQHRIIASLRHPASLLDVPQSRGNQLLIASGDAFPLGSKDDVESLITQLVSYIHDSMNDRIVVKSKKLNDEQLTFLPSD